MMNFPGGQFSFSLNLSLLVPTSDVRNVALGEMRNICFPPGMKLPLLAALIALAPFAHAAPEPTVLWPKGAPGETGTLPAEADATKPSDALVSGKPVIRLGNVSIPTITVFPAPAEKANGTAVLVCPGGGFSILAMDLEGTEVCEWLNSIGVTAVLLKYRVPARAGLPKHAPALQDAQRAMGLIRQHAAEWHIEADRVGCLGFSAGGNLCAVLAASAAARTYDLVDDADKQSCRPDFMTLIYPAYLTLKDQGDAVSPDAAVSATTPPTFMAMTADDPVRAETALFYYLALKNAKVAAELHLYPTGGHGYGLRPTPFNVSAWPKRAEEWLRTLGALEKRPDKVP